MTGGLIPAHAGKTSVEPEKQVIHCHSPGSSPLTRGKPRKIQQGLRSWRLIPAHAGKTYAWCGAFQVWAGSPPLTRGKRGGCVEELAPRGLIPAHAGKTSRMSVAAWAAQAHPRSRGENTALNAEKNPATAHPRSRGENRSSSLLSRSEAGSSPLTRGKRVAIRG